MKSFKKILLVAIMIFSTAVIANAQFRWGIKAGMNVNKIHFNNQITEDFINKGNSTGWTAGLMTEFTVPLIGVGMDVSLMYARMNNAADDEITTVDNNTEVSEGKLYGRNFLELPINIKYKLTLPAVSNLVKPMIFTGPNFAFKLDKNVLKEMKTKTCQVAWQIGLGVELINHVQIAGSYSFGINNIADKTMGVDAVDIKAKNNYWTITAAYLF